LRRGRSGEQWVEWFNRPRLLEPIGNAPPAELELAYAAEFLEAHLMPSQWTNFVLDRRGVA